MLTKLFRADQIREIDRQTVLRQGITSDALMERAATRLFRQAVKYITAGQRIVILAGPGNNGGDALVVARLMARRDYPVRVMLVPYSPKTSPDFDLNLQRLKDTGITPETFKGELPGADLYLDGIFGTGLNRPASGIAREAIRALNRSGKPVFSVDLPSGLYADRLNDPDDAIVKASHVFTFQFPKISFFYRENAAYVPQYHTIDIGLEKTVMDEMPTSYYLVTDWKDWFPTRPPFADKSHFGHACLIGGSFGKAGAIGFAAQAAYRIGAGWVTARVPSQTALALQITAPQIMVSADSHPEIPKSFPQPDPRKTYGIGPGLGTHPLTVKALEDWLRKNNNPIVIDADGLNILARHPRLLKLLPPGSVLTPHLAEWQRLNGSVGTTPQNWEQAKAFARKHQIILVLKGHYTVITDGQRLHINPTGNPALAKAGMGDVLTGMITGLMAQGVAPLHAALAAVYMHGKIADQWIVSQNQFALQPQDVIRGLTWLDKMSLCNVRF